MGVEIFRLKAYLLLNNAATEIAKKMLLLFWCTKFTIAGKRTDYNAMSLFLFALMRIVRYHNAQCALMRIACDTHKLFFGHNIDTLTTGTNHVELYRQGAKMNSCGNRNVCQILLTSNM